LPRDYQSGTKLPHSKGFADVIGDWASIKRLAVLIFTLLFGHIFSSGEAIAETQQVEDLTVVATAAPVGHVLLRKAAESAALTGRLELIQRFPTILPIQKVDGRIPEEICSLHGERMRLGLTNILYGLPEAEIGSPNDLAHIWQKIRQKIRRRFSYYEAAGKYFPESKLWVWGGCMVEIEKKAETLYCQSCRNAELNWRKKHPGKGIGFDAVISGGIN